MDDRRIVVGKVASSLPASVSWNTMESQQPYTAVRELQAEDPSLGSSTIRVCVGQPYAVRADDWACPLALGLEHLRLAGSCED